MVATMSGSLEGHQTVTDGKEIKVRIPLDFHIKLHTLKVLKGQSISDTVELALRKYFTEFSGEVDRRQYAEVAARAIVALQ
ncbi:MAG: hypothetical protein ACYDDF_13360 [Thermoplasmatota archaeon]